MAYKGGQEITVNTHVKNNQSQPAITTLTDGGWIVTWASYGQDGAENGIYSQRYDADGSTHGGEKQVNASTPGNQFMPDVAGLDDGGWVETWSSKNKHSGYEILEQAYNANGSKRGGETHVNSFIGGDQDNSHISALSDGGWVVTWQSEGADGDGNAICERAYNANGTARTGEIIVNSVTTSDQFDADVASLKGGGWVVTWASYGHAGDFSGIYQQVFNANGTTMGGEVHVNSHTAENQYKPAVCVLRDGGWVVTWESQDQDGSGYGIYQQRYDADGSEHGGERRVNSHTASEQDTSDVAALSNGGWVATWESDGQDGNASGIYAQAYHADGSKDGKEFLVDTHTNSEQLDPAVTALAHGHFVISWQSYDRDGDLGAICQRVFKPDHASAKSEPAGQSAIAGGKGDDTLVGTDHDDIMHGRGGNDTLSGKAGADILNGGTGSDLLVGGAGNDVFIFRTGSGNDAIRDFVSGDKIDLSHFSATTNFVDLVKNHMEQIGADVLIDQAGGDTLIIRHVLVDNLHASDFIFT